MTRRGGEAAHMGWEEGVLVLGSLRVSQVFSGRESGRYLIVIASMERTEAGPVRKFLIYLVFLFSLLFPSLHLYYMCRGEGGALFHWGGGSRCTLGAKRKEIYGWNLAKE